MTVDRGQAASLSVTVDGLSLAAVPGETVAAALVAHGLLAQGVGKDGGPRGHFCGMGVCHDCLVAIDGRPGQRACLAKVADGMSIQLSDRSTVRIGDGTHADVAPRPDAGPASRSIDVLVVGAGPAGLSAALSAAQAGSSVLLVDERPAAGGQYYKQAGSPMAAPPDGQMRAGAALVESVKAAGVVLEGETLVWGVARATDGGLDVSTMHDGVAGLVRPAILIIATGAFERPAMVPGWTLPGVMTPGAAQTLLRSYGVRPGKKVVVAGNGPLNLQVARELQRAGAQVTLVEAAPAPWSRPAAAARLAIAGPLLALDGLSALLAFRLAGGRALFGARLLEVEGEAKAERAVIATGREGGPSDRTVIPVDAVLVADGFAPAAELARLLGLDMTTDKLGSLVVVRGDDGATAQPDVFVVGEAGGFGGAHIAAAQGGLAGRAAAARLGRRPVGSDEADRRQLARHRRFQSALWTLFAAPPSPLPGDGPDRLVCRCEAVSLSTLRTTIATHAVSDVATLKRLTRAGMGRCQGRYCASVLRDLVGASPTEAALPAPQMPVRPVALAALAVQKPEWGGHRRVMLPDRALPPGPPLPVREAATVVIGAGIAGLSTALYLAREGHDVVVLDRGPVNAGASGGNAGSLHAQLLSFDHGARAEAGGGPAARTLPLQRDSIALWQSLEAELGLDFEITITGGLMVAETEQDLAFLAAKTAVERAQGIDCDIIGHNDLCRLEPALDPRFVGAAFCPQEGKINPLVATEGIHRAALAAGARVLTGVEVQAIDRGPSGFSLATNRGEIRAGRVVNAAGAFASRIGAMLGVDIPVHGAPLQMIVTEPAEPVISRLVAHADRHLTLKQARNGAFIIGGGWTAALDPVRQHPRPLRESIEGNLWVAQHVVPGLRKLHVLRSWAAMNINIDGAPILGEHPVVPGFFTCVTSNGYTLGPIMGRTTAAMILHGDAGRDVTPFSVARFG